jgi:hypothetical protein
MLSMGYGIVNCSYSTDLLASRSKQQLATNNGLAHSDGAHAKPPATLAHDTYGLTGRPDAGE